MLVGVVFVYFLPPRVQKLAEGDFYAVGGWEIFAGVDPPLPLPPILSS